MGKTASLLAGLILGMALVGCGVQSTQSVDAENKAEDKEAKLQKNLAKLPPEDRKLAEQQKYCAVEPDNRLGSMGKPFKVMVKDQPVFLCCSGCKDNVEENPDKYLQVAQKMREKSSSKSEPRK